MYTNKTMKTAIIPLAVNGSNQREFLTSLRVAAGQLGAMQCLTKDRSDTMSSHHRSFFPNPNLNGNFLEIVFTVVSEHF
jgi:hypothetical protein